MLPFLSLGLLHRILFMIPVPLRIPDFLRRRTPGIVIETIASQDAAETSTQALHAFFGYMERLRYACDVEFVLPGPTFVRHRLAQIPRFSLRLASGSDSG